MIFSQISDKVFITYHYINRNTTGDFKKSSLKLLNRLKVPKLYKQLMHSTVVILAKVMKALQLLYDTVCYVYNILQYCDDNGYGYIPQVCQQQRNYAEMVWQSLLQYVIRHN